MGLMVLVAKWVVLQLGFLVKRPAKYIAQLPPSSGFTRTHGRMLAH